jgi:hypothetical protein
VAASKCEKQAKIFLNSPQHAYTVVSHGIAIDVKFLEVYPVGAPSIALMIAGVPPFLSNETILNVLRPFCPPC